MSKIGSIIKYFCIKYPHKDELSKARLTKMVYLADWESAKTRHIQLTDISWYFNHYGPYVDDVLIEAKNDPDIEIVETLNAYGTPKIMVNYKNHKIPTDLQDDEIKILDLVIKDTAPKTWNPFIKHVYETYPIRTADRYEILNLVRLADEEQSR